jgi:hypothetical protein
MKKQLHLLFFCACSLSLLNSKVFLQSTDSYNIVWKTPSQNASESMPCGGGDIGLNVWVEKGELLIYVARSGNFDENNALLKSGRLRIKLFPNPFGAAHFKQELKLNEGYVQINGQTSNTKVQVKIWVDVFHPVANIEINASKKITAEASYESWRYQDRVLQARENFANSYKWAAPKNNIGRKDEINFAGNSVLFYHQNHSPTIFDITVHQQGMDSVKEQLYNPLKDLVFGGLLTGQNFISNSTTDGIFVNTDYRAWNLETARPAKQLSLSLFLNNGYTDDVSKWKSSLDSLVKSYDRKKNSTASINWWHQFWNRSFIRIDESKSGSKAWEVGRNFQLFRYMLACNAFGKWPTKFNGGLFTVDPVFTDASQKLTPDYRNWGGGLHTMQNQRLVYFPMEKNGDWDLMQAQIEFYLRILKNAELRSQVYWHHDGACFTEQMENYGLPDYAEYGQNRPEGFDKGLEYNAWLEYLWDTVLEFCFMMLEEERYTSKDIHDRIPFIESCLRFFDEHYQYLAKQRGIKALDGEGKLVLYPGSGAETFKMAYNSSSTIAGLQTIARRLLELPNNYLDEEKRKHWKDFLNRLPAISYTKFDGHVTIAPAKLWERINNAESPQLYPVFPWGIFGVGKSGLDTAINTWTYDTNVVRFKSHVGWKQDNIWAARLGLADSAWKYTSLKLQNSGKRFPAFWGPGFDWLPDHNWGGSGMIGLQEMLLQTDDRRIFLFPAWPKNLDVHFKLHAPYNTTVEAELKNGKIISMKVIPGEREKDIENYLEK